ncbi:MAG: DUF3465 domain-containing protein [Phycisphaerales bacterium JB041]
MAKPKKAGLGVGGLVLVVAIVLLARVLGIDLSAPEDGQPPSTPASQRESAVANAGSAGDTGFVEELFAEQRSGVMVTVRGEVVHVLPDDNEGSRHQRFLVELTTDRTLLVAHNIDLAERVPLREGDSILIRGQYEWTEKGGTLHWTHHDPGNRREGGWIEHGGARYE